MNSPGRAPAAYFAQRRPEVCDLVVGSGLRVLDLGCGEGGLGAELLARGTAAVVHGVEHDRGAAAQASDRLDRVWLADLERGLGGAADHCYDVVIAADVLEHLREPWEVLAAAMRRLAPGGQLVASFPNVRFVRVLAPLVLRGRFEYQASGVLDRTHLRFFTRASVETLLADAGLVPEVVQRAPMAWRTGWKAAAGRLLGDFGTEQFLVRARRSAH